MPHTDRYEFLNFSIMKNSGTSNTVFKRLVSSQRKKAGTSYGSNGMFGGEGGRYGAGNYHGVQGMYGGSGGAYAPGNDGRFGNQGAGGRRQSCAEGK
ncbi:MAG: hypothetical protein EOP48_28920 [Sphingobacteriales bacterium]|nr:MAG: hypothetical protein EOP48_28920 [Sphingobacteriales bacterium]